MSKVKESEAAVFILFNENYKHGKNRYVLIPCSKNLTMVLSENLLKLKALIHQKNIRGCLSYTTHADSRAGETHQKTGWLAA